MFRSTKSWLVALLAVGSTLILATASIAAPLPGVYWVQLDQNTNATGSFYYAPFSGAGIGATSNLGPINTQATGLTVSAIGATDYLYVSGCCGGSNGTARGVLTGASMGALSGVNGNQELSVAIDKISAAPKIYYTTGNQLRQADPNGSNDILINSFAYNVKGTHMYSDGTTNRLFVGPNGDNPIVYYNFAADGTPVGGGTQWGTFTTTGGGDTNDLDYDPVTNTLYYVNNNGNGTGTNVILKSIAEANPVDAATSGSFATGDEVKTIALDRTNNYLYVSKQAPGLLERINLTTGAIESLAVNNIGGDDLVQRVFAVEVVNEDINAVPEPSTFVLATLGLVGLGFFARKKRRNA
ncbi:MAG: PEP-CTERM sorting domain-containing protein [Planctomycetes bacterium]|nr:PEP-CTERM sorting domain-containing protein [Planctomycetota bacterium]